MDSLFRRLRVLDGHFALGAAAALGDVFRLGGDGRLPGGLPVLFLLLRASPFIALALSIVVAAPIVWTGLEVARGYMFGGFTMSSLAHTQYRWVAWIQRGRRHRLLRTRRAGHARRRLCGADDPMGGPTRRQFGQSPRLWPRCALPVGYGDLAHQRRPHAPGATVALIQGAIDTTFDDEPRQGQPRDGAVHGASRRRPSSSHRRDRQQDPSLPDIDLIVWPESMFRSSLVSFATDYEMSPGTAAIRAGNNTKEEIEAERRAVARQILRSTSHTGSRWTGPRALYTGA